MNPLENLPKIDAIQKSVDKPDAFSKPSGAAHKGGKGAPAKGTRFRPMSTTKGKPRMSRGDKRKVMFY